MSRTIHDDTLYELSEPFLEYIMENKIAPELPGRSPDEDAGGKGKPVDGIPYTSPNCRFRTLTLLNMDNGATLTGRVSSQGPYKPYNFSQQSMSKASSACLLMTLLDPANPFQAVQQFKGIVGNSFSSEAYNQDILTDKGIPANYSHNMGAIKVWSAIVARTPGQSGDVAVQKYLDFLGNLTGTKLQFNEQMAQGEFGEAHSMNWTLLDLLGRAESDPNHFLKSPEKRRRAYLAYCRGCAVMVTTLEAAKIFGVIANSGREAGAGRQCIPALVAQHVFSGLSQHGSYDESLKLFDKVGMHAKTGVGGGIMGWIPRHSRWVFCGHHSDLNGYGNSGEVIKWLTELGRLNLAWPAPGTPAARNFPALEPTGRALDYQLRSEMGPGQLNTLDQHIARFAPTVTQGNPGKRGFYLKLKVKGMSTAGGTRLMTERSTTGQVRTYWYVPDNHYMHKIVVEAVEDKYRVPGAYVW